ncbi:MAG: endonuclease III domain-containing protein [Dehalococcoidia bacterium]
MQHQLVEIYRRLLEAFGYQRWWPGETREEVIIGAILTQNVAWKNVETAIDNLRQHDLLALKAIHEADISEIARLIRPTRFYNQKAQKLKRLSDFLFDRYRGDLDAMFAEGGDRLRQELLGIGGLGEETVDSILLYAGKQAVFVVDAYTKRIFVRLGLTDEKWSYRAYREFFMQFLDRDPGLYNDYHAQIVRLGRAYCKKNAPECTLCPLADLCRYCVSRQPHGCSDRPAGIRGCR